MPPTDDVQSAVTQIMAPFSDDNDTSYTFWDWWVIGGRWSADHIMQSLDPDRKKLFFERLTELKVTVSGFVAGKDTLKPASQIETVDSLWREIFPGSPVKSCPFFSHFNDQYKHSSGFPDVVTLKDIPEGFTCDRVIVAGQEFSDPTKLEACLMFQYSFWNGVNHIDSTWDKLLSTAVSARIEGLSRAKPEYSAKRLPQPDWLCVTVDYHS